MGKFSRAVTSLHFLAKRSLPLVLFLPLLLYILAKEYWIQPSPKPSPTLQSTSPISMDPNTQLAYEFAPFLRLYKSGRVERFTGTQVVAAGTDEITGVTSKDVVIDRVTNLAARLYLPQTTAKDEKLPILVYIHGGAFVIESAFSPTYHRYLNSLVAKARIVAVSVEYRLAPEHPLPVAYDDAWQAVKWVASNCSAGGGEAWLAEHGDPGRIFVAGDSAGGNIAHEVAIRAGSEKGARIRGLVLMNPYFWGKDPVGSETRDPGVRWTMESTWSFVCDGKYGIDHYLANPFGHVDMWKGLGCQRVLVTVSELDLFHERGVAYVEGLRKSGWTGEVEMYETKGEDHVYYLTYSNSKKALKELEVVSSFLNRP
ncbi:probable carboxylesterase 7 [Typha latifolia]|uniref:probable carboxylesterase 7 n=1 Tax=Typha latifolia TaxID=4733 RepID=UPI003C2ED417